MLLVVVRCSLSLLCKIRLAAYATIDPFYCQWALEGFWFGAIRHGTTQNILVRTGSNSEQVFGEHLGALLLGIFLEEIAGS